MNSRSERTNSRMRASGPPVVFAYDVYVMFAAFEKNEMKINFFSEK